VTVGANLAESTGGHRPPLQKMQGFKFLTSMFGPRKSQRVRPAFPFSFRLWWREVTGPLHRSQHRSLWAAIRRRILLVLPAAVLLFILLAVPGTIAFTHWRAKDLATKSLANMARGERRLAYLQAESAASFREDLPEVIRARALARTAYGDPASIDYWNKLEEAGAMRSEDLTARAEGAATFGSPRQLADAVRALESAGREREARLWQARHAFRRNDLGGAEKFFREALSLDDSLEARLELARVLGAIGTPASQAEAVRIIAEASPGPEGPKVLAFGLKHIDAGPATRRAWAEQAWADASADNPALLPAATVMVDDRHWTSDEAVARLDRVFLGAPLEQRVDYAEWLAARNRPREEITRRILMKDARASARAFRVRAESAVELGDWQGVLEMLDAGSLLDEPTSWILRARAESALGRKAAARTSLRKALQAAMQTMSLPATLIEADEMMQTALANEVLLEACGEPSSAEYVLRVARWRFGQRGEPARLDEVFRRSPRQASELPTVRDLHWRRELLDGQPVDPVLTQEVVEREPSNVEFRITHALALLRDGRAAEARLALAPLEPVSHQLFAGQKAVLAAVLSASGSPNEATELVRSINPQHLSDAEYRLVYSLATAADPPSGR
jgi:tetratricopeptide (TPR) repeat protein